MSSPDENMREQHERLREVFQELVGLEDEVSDGSFCVKYAAVVVYADPDGSSWICYRSGDAAEAGLATWDIRGLLHEWLSDLDARGVERQLDDES